MVFLGRIVFLLSMVEALVFAGVASDIGFLRAAFLEMLFMAGGLFLLQFEGAEMVRAFFTQKRTDGGDVFDSLCRVLAGFLFLFPGFISDLFGILLLVPGLRSHLRKTSFFNFLWSRSAAQQNQPDEGVIEGDYRVLEEDNPQIPTKTDRQE